MDLDQEITPTPTPRKISRLDPELAATVNAIKTTIATEGYYGINEFKQMVQLTGYSPEGLLMYLEEEGITHVLTTAVNKDVTQEVLVDVRQMAAAMLLIYSDKSYAKNNSVFKYLKTLFGIGGWESAFELMLLDPLLHEMYEQHGHNFTYMKIAENANLFNEEDSAIVNRAERFVNPMRELVKSDAELTAVYHLAKRVMDVVNGVSINGHYGTRKDVQYRNFKDPVAYPKFWVAAQTILDMHEKEQRKK
jgi:hypothetical protein